MTGDDRQQRSAFLHYIFLQCAVTVDIELETLQETRDTIRNRLVNNDDFDQYLELPLNQWSANGGSWAIIGHCLKMSGPPDEFQKKSGLKGVFYFANIY